MKITNGVLYWSFFLSLFVWIACANPVALQGGKKDTQAPEIDSSKTFTPNLLTNYNGETIVLPFTEWVELNSPYTQVLVSPPLDEPLNIKLKGKSVRINFKDTLKSNTTYTINFGEAIRDITEKNVVKNFTYVFSTGQAIDSLSVNGFVVDAITGDPVEDALVMLYDNLEDSVSLKEKPYYFTKTDNSGSFRLSYLKADSFKIFVLKDENSNYKYDLTTEKIGFLYPNFILTDSSNITFKVRLFQERVPFKIEEQYTKTFGKIDLQFNKDVKDLDWEILDQPDFVDVVEQEKTFLTLWYSDTIKRVKLVLKDSASSWTDTVKLKLPKFKRTERFGLKSPRSSKGGARSRKNTLSQPLEFSLPDDLIIRFDQPLSLWDTSLMRLVTDSISIPFSIKKLESDPFAIEVKAEWKKEGEYELQLQKGAIKDYLQASSDTLKIRFKTIVPPKNGNIIATIRGMDSQTSYVVFLKDKEGNIQQRDVVQSDSSIVLTYRNLKPVDYGIEVIHDNNNNGVWDSGDYFKQRQPERITKSETLNLRPDWDMDIDVQVDPNALSKSKKSKGKRLQEKQSNEK